MSDDYDKQKPNSACRGEVRCDALIGERTAGNTSTNSRRCSNSTSSGGFSSILMQKTYRDDSNVLVNTPGRSFAEENGIDAEQGSSAAETNQSNDEEWGTHAACVLYRAGLRLEARGRISAAIGMYRQALKLDPCLDERSIYIEDHQTIREDEEDGDVFLEDDACAEYEKLLAADMDCLSPQCIRESRTAAGTVGQTESHKQHVSVSPTPQKEGEEKGETKRFLVEDIDQVHEEDRNEELTERRLTEQQKKNSEDWKSRTVQLEKKTSEYCGFNRFQRLRTFLCEDTGSEEKQGESIEAEQKEDHKEKWQEKEGNVFLQSSDKSAGEEVGFTSISVGSVQGAHRSQSHSSSRASPTSVKKPDTQFFHEEVSDAAAVALRHQSNNKASYHTTGTLVTDVRTPGAVTPCESSVGAEEFSTHVLALPKAEKCTGEQIFRSHTEDKHFSKSTEKSLCGRRGSPLVQSEGARDPPVVSVQTEEGKGSHNLSAVHETEEKKKLIFYERKKVSLADGTGHEETQQHHGGDVPRCAGVPNKRKGSRNKKTSDVSVSSNPLTIQCADKEKAAVSATLVVVPTRSTIIKSNSSSCCCGSTRITTANEYIAEAGRSVASANEKSSCAVASPESEKKGLIMSLDDKSKDSACAGSRGGGDSGKKVFVCSRTDASSWMEACTTPCCSCRSTEITETSSEEFSWLWKLPSDLLLSLPFYLDAYSLTRLSMSCQLLQDLCGGKNDRCWREKCFQVFGSRCSAECHLYSDSWHRMYLHRPRIRMDGIYISRSVYLRRVRDVGRLHLVENEHEGRRHHRRRLQTERDQELSAATVQWINDLMHTAQSPVYAVTYHRYLRFLPEAKGNRVLVLRTEAEKTVAVQALKMAEQRLQEMESRKDSYCSSLLDLAGIQKETVRCSSSSVARGSPYNGPSSGGSSQRSCLSGRSPQSLLPLVAVGEFKFDWETRRVHVFYNEPRSCSARHSCANGTRGRGQTLSRREGDVSATRKGIHTLEDGREGSPATTIEAARDLVSEQKRGRTEVDESPSTIQACSTDKCGRRRFTHCAVFELFGGPGGRSNSRLRWICRSPHPFSTNHERS